MKAKVLNLFLSLTLFLNITSCGQSKEEERDEAIKKALILLTQRKCSEAVSVLETAGRDGKNVAYLKTLASAYACLGGFDVLRLFQTDLPLIVDPAPMGGMSRFTTSTMDSATDSGFTNIQTAIDILLYAGDLPTDEDPSPSVRAANFSNSEAQEINALLMYLLIVQLGNYFKYYGNTNAAGVKGGGSGSNTNCFLDFDGTVTLVSGPPNDLNDYITTSGATGVCTVVNGSDGHPDLGAIGSYNKTRMCQGVVLMNNFFLIFPSVIAGVGGDDFTDLATLESQIETAKSELLSRKPGGETSTYNVLSQEKCVADNAGNDEYLQVYFAFMFEVFVQ